jgi:myo-inositol catabolism protein IolC
VSAPMNLQRVFMLASDHRWQWEAWCDEAGVVPARIADVKQLVVEAFLQARAQSADVRRAGALLLDTVYGAAAIGRARAAGVPVGIPVEKAGVFPLEWQQDPCHAGLSGHSFAKVLIRHRPEWEPDVRRRQMDKLLELQAWCRGERMPLLIEVVIMRQDEPRREFEAVGRPRLLASVIRDAYSRELEPDLWKIEGAGSAEGAAIVDEAIRERPGPRQIILGKGADAEMIASWFDHAARLPSAVGFAMGRSVFWDPGTAYLRGTLPAAAASQAMASRYLHLIEEWERRLASSGDRS